MPIKPGWQGRYFEDFEVGDVYQCRLGRTVTEADNIWFTLLTNNTNQIHFNNEYGKRTEFHQPSGIKFTTDNEKRELFDMIGERLAPVLEESSIPRGSRSR